VLHGIVPTEPRHISPLRWNCGFQCAGFGGVYQRCNFTHHLLNLRVLAHMGGIAMAVDPFAAAHLMRHILEGRAADAGEGGEQHQLIERCLVFEARGKVDDVFRLHHRIGKTRGAAAGGTLAKAVPVIALRHAGLAGAGGGNHIAAGVAALGVDVDPVGKQAAGAVELFTVEFPFVAVGADFSDDIADGHAADFGPGAAHDLTVDKAFEPEVSRRAGCGIQAVFGKREVPAQGLGHVGVGFGQFDQQFE